MKFKIIPLIAILFLGNAVVQGTALFTIGYINYFMFGAKRGLHLLLGGPLKGRIADFVHYGFAIALVVFTILIFLGCFNAIVAKGLKLHDLTPDEKNEWGSTFARLCNELNPGSNIRDVQLKLSDNPKINSLNFANTIVVNAEMFRQLKPGITEAALAIELCDMHTDNYRYRMLFLGSFIGGVLSIPAFFLSNFWLTRQNYAIDKAVCNLGLKDELLDYLKYNIIRTSGNI